jgi:hypothetical protein
MLSIFSTSKVWALVAMLVVGMTVVALVGCQVHTVSHDPMQVSPAGHQRPPSPHTPLNLLCLVAALPLVVSLAPVSLVMPYAIRLCAVSRTDGIATRGGRSSGLMTPRRTTYLDPKGRGDKSMLVKRETAEDV